MRTFYEKRVKGGTFGSHAEFSTNVTRNPKALCSCSAFTDVNTLGYFWARISTRVPRAPLCFLANILPALSEKVADLRGWDKSSKELHARLFP